MVKLEENVTGEDSYDIDWSSEDDRDIDRAIENYGNASNSSLIAAPVRGPVANAEEGSSSNPIRSEIFLKFTGMGFPDKLVAKAIEENGEEEYEQILNTLLTYSNLEDSPENVQTSLDLEDSPQQLDADCDWSSDYNEDVEESDSWSEDEANGSPSSDKNKLLSLANMGYTVEEASIAIERCGPDAPILELTDFISAAQFSKNQDAFFPEEKKPRRNLLCVMGRNKKQKLGREIKKKKHTVLNERDKIRLPKPMIGFGVPTESCPRFSRHLPEAAIGPPYFYYENVAMTPKGEWDKIKSFLYEVEPEFVDSKFLCAAARKRGYIHNLAIDNRFPVLPLPPRTIQEAFPLTKRWWPKWDKRTKLNCLQTCIGSAKLTERIRKSLEGWEDEPPLDTQKFVLEQCKKWNLVWVGKNKLAPLECDEVEMLLGFPRNHTRGGGISRTDRYKSLGNSFQVDTVAYHLSVLKELYPDGLNMLSLFSGIGGAEVALHRLGIPLKNVVSVEKSAVNRNIVRSFWEQTNQRGTLIDFEDVLKLDKDRLRQVMGLIGGFDLVIGGSPCNNLAGSNRHHRDGLEGKESSLFFEYFRILAAVKEITAEMNKKKISR